ncbi:MAG: PEP-CTERM sorting domain-containing protein, partial [Candidatus Omnitrophica bacterium]|nr:PEP-CTERM sorting domain-containing protein [Candidatus Omnitrophota bacterium]
MFAALPSAPSEATPFVDMTFNGLSSGASYQFSVGNGSGGIFRWTVNDNDVTDTGNPFPVTNGDTLITFCIELVETISTNQAVIYESIDPSGAPVNNGIYGPLGYAKKMKMRAWFGNFWQGNSVSDWTSDQARAFQLGLWEIVYEDYAQIGNINSGVFTRTGGSTSGVSTANNWFATMDDNVMRTFFALSAPNTEDSRLKQDQVTVPEPTTVALISAGVVAMAHRK